MTSFNTGFRQGADMYNAAQRLNMAREEMELRRAADARAAELHGQTMQEGGLRLGSMRRVEDATNALTNLQTLGVQNPGAVESNRQANMESLRRFEIGQQNEDPEATYVAPTGLQPTYRPATDRELNTAQMGLASARGDMAGIAALQAARRNLDISDIASKVMKTPTAELEKMAPDLNMSGYPLLYTGKDPKTGYTFLKTQADGKTPIPGSQFSLNENQLRQLALAHELGGAGFGTEAMATLNVAHKDLGDHVAKWNAAMSSSTTANNTAIHNANADASGRTTANAAMTNANSMSEWRKAQQKVIDDMRGDKQEALAIMAKFDELTPEQQAGPEGQALVQRFNTLAVKAGGTVALQPKGGKGSGKGLLAMPVEQKKNDDGTYTAFAKDGGQALYNTINGEAIPLGMDAQTYAAQKKAAQQNGVKLIVGENNGRLELRFQGADGQFYEDAQTAKYAKAESPTPKAGGLKTPSARAAATTSGTPGEITMSINPQTKQKTYVVQGLRQRFATRAEAEEAAKGVSGSSDMSRALNKYGD